MMLLPYLNLNVLFIQAVLVHNPVSLLAVGSPSDVEHQGLPQADPPGVAEEDGLVPPCRLPEPCRGGTVRPRPRWVLLVLVAEEVPLILRPRPDPAPICIHNE